MSGWISSKLKVAETLLQQIDQQAAESLRKNEKSRSDELSHDKPRKPSEILPLKDQLKKKTPENNDFVGKLRNGNNFNAINNDDNRDQSTEVGTSVNVHPKSSLTDSDWTELLSAPRKTANGSNGVPGVHGLRKDGKRQGRSGSDLSALERRRSQKAQNSVSKSPRKLDILLESKINGGGLDGKPSDGEDVKFSDSTRSSVELQGVRESSDSRQLDGEAASGSIVVEHRNEENVKRNNKLGTLGDLEQLHSRDRLLDGVSRLKDENRPQVMLSANVNKALYLKTGLNGDRNRFRKGVVRINEADAGPETSASRRGYSSVSDGGSDSETDSDSTSDAESELEREERRRRREQILAEKAAAKAVEVLKERENLVARLEGEKQSLEKILEERAKQQALEASELQMTMMETMEAVDLEKQKHNNTRMEALARLAKLETANADLAKSLATAQWNLEIEVNQVAELRQQIEMKEASYEELRWKTSNRLQTGHKSMASKGVEFEHEILEAEYTFVTDKVGRLQEKAKTLETSIEMARKEMENPTEVEIELKRRLRQLTDHLIQKQVQVEALSSEKAMLLFRIEAVSRLLDENKSMLNMAVDPKDDLESGTWELSNSRLKPLFEESLRSGQKHLGSLVRQLDTIFSAGVVFLRRNRTARMWSFVYLVCLHIWVLYILMSHSPVSDEGRSSAVISLENINNTGSV